MAAGPRVARRTFLRGAASAVALTGVGWAGAVEQADAARGDRLPFRMAMHLHASFSEGPGSMQAHLHQATKTGVDIVWWTEHDHRMVARNYLRKVHFDGLSEYAGGTGVVWRSHFEGSLASSSASIVSSPVSPNDTGGLALQLAATSRPNVSGTRRLVADASDYGLNTSLDGTTISLDIFPIKTGANAWTDIRIETSYRPALRHRPAGAYGVTYRVGGSDPIGTRKLVTDLEALVVVDAPTGEWTTLVLDPVTDLDGFWSDIDFRDSALTEFSLAATSRSRKPSTSVFDTLRFDRVRRSVDEVLQTQQSLIDLYSQQYPKVTQLRGMEVSDTTPHLGWLGNPGIWPTSDPANQDLELAVRKIHHAGGLASYNHPFGSSGGPYSTSQRISKRRSVTATLVKARLFKAEVLEVGYLGGRAGLQLSDYVSVWDVLSRNAIFATGVGASDDHAGRNWLTEKWRCITGVWASDASELALQRALADGRAWFCDLAAFSGTINLTANGYVSMGEVSLVNKNHGTLAIEVTGLPSDWSIVLVSGVVDEAGPDQPDPLVSRREFTVAEMVGSVLTTTINTASSTFFRVELRDANQVSRVFSNPVWMLRAAPAYGIPPGRAATVS